MRVSRAVLLAAGAGAFGSLDTSLNIAFPDLVADFDIETAQLQWVVVSFVLTYGGLLLAAGQLGDRVGHRRMLTAGAMGSVVAMAACALAPTFGWFLAARIGQGVTTALVMAAGPALASAAAPSEQKGSAIGVFQLSAGLGAAVGPVVGGPLVDIGGWPAVFWYRIPVSLALLWLARSVRQTSAPEVTTSRDVRGAVLTAVALSAGLLVVTSGRELGWTSIGVGLAAAVAAFAGWAYVRHCGRHEAPIVDLRMFREPSFAVANLNNVTTNGAMFVAWLLAPSLLVDEIGLTTVTAGIVLAAQPAAMAALSPLAGRWMDRAGPNVPVLCGIALEALGLLWLATIDGSSSTASAVGAMVLIGGGLGLFAAPNMASVMARLPAHRQGVAGSLSLLTRTAGIVTGVAAWSAVFDHLERTRSYSDAFALTSYLAAAVLAATLLISVAQLGLTRRTQ